MNNTIELKKHLSDKRFKHLSTLIELGLYDHVEIWSSTFSTGLLIEKFEYGISINWFRLNGEQEHFLVIF